MASTNENNVTVFVTQHCGKLNYSEAQQFGNVTFLTDKEYRVEPVPAAYNDSIKKQMIDFLSANYVQGHDFILLTGSPMPSVIVGEFIGSKPGTHKFLKWNNQRHSYDTVLIRVGNR